MTLGIAFSRPRGTTAPVAPPVQAAVPVTAGAVAQAPPPKVVPVGDSVLQFQIDHQFADGTLSLWIDGKLARTQAIHGKSKRKLVLFHGTRGEEAGSLRVASGKHRVRVRVASTDGFNLSGDANATFVAGTPTYLEIKCDKANKKLELKLR